MLIKRSERMLRNFNNIGKIVHSIIFDLDKFYLPEKRKLKLHTINGRKINYSKNYPEFNVIQENIIIKYDKTFLYGDSNRVVGIQMKINGSTYPPRWLFNTQLKLLIKHYYNDLKLQCFNFILAEKCSYSYINELNNDIILKKRKFLNDSKLKDTRNPSSCPSLNYPIYHKCLHSFFGDGFKNNKMMNSISMKNLVSI